MMSYSSLFLAACSFAVVAGQDPTVAPTRAPTAPTTFAPTRAPTASPTLFPTVFFTNPGFPLCSVCNEEYRVTDRNAPITIPGYGTYTCGQFEQIGFDGFISAAECPFVPFYSLPACGCTELVSESYCNVCGVLGKMTKPSGKVVREGFSTISCSFYQELGAKGAIPADQCDSTNENFLIANSECGCELPSFNNPPCPTCDTNFTLGDPTATFTFEGEGLLPLSCADFEKAGIVGLIPASVCAAATTSAIAACGGCVDVPGSFAPCNPCGLKFIDNLDAFVTLINTTSAITCAEYARSGGLGFVAPDVCEINVNATRDACGCIDAPPSSSPSFAPSPSPPTDAPSKSPTTKTPTKSPTKTPTTKMPTTKSPTTKRPTTKKPTTRKPTTKKPTTRKPTTKKPTTKKPTTKKPTTKKPTTRKPTTKKPTTK